MDFREIKRVLEAIEFFAEGNSSRFVDEDGAPLESHHQLLLDRGLIRITEVDEPFENGEPCLGLVDNKERCFMIMDSGDWTPSGVLDWWFAGTAEGRRVQVDIERENTVSV